jgi:aarF domain-containing kinase
VRQWKRINTDLAAFVDEWAASLYKELDYQLEAASGERFRHQLEGMQNLVLIPRTYQNLSTRRVLIQEWVEGVKVTDVSDKRVAARIVEVGVYCSLAQLLDRGFYHADPHPGNLMYHSSDGRLAYLDFGMMGELKRDLRFGLISMLVHMVNKEWDALAEDFVELEMLPSDADAARIAPALTTMLKGYLDQSDVTLSDVSFSQLAVTLSETMYEYNFRMPSYYTLIIRSLSVLEGIATQNDPSFRCDRI